MRPATDGLEIALAEALARDLDRAFEDLVLTFQDRIYGFALRISRNPRDAEEIAQDAFVRAYRALRTYSYERIRQLVLRPWLYRITLNVYRNRVRRPRADVVSLEQANGDGWEPAERVEWGPEAMAERAAERAELSAALMALPDRYRLAVILRHVEQLSYPELAAALEQPIGTVKANVHRGVRLLRAALEQHDMELDTV